MEMSDFLYDLPEEAIAQSAVEPRDAARLLDTRTMTDHRFRDLPELLREGDLVVVNRTRVRPARLFGKKETGGGVELLLLRNLSGSRWEALVRPARRLRVGASIHLGDAEVRLVSEPDDGIAIIEAEADLADLADEQGEVPLPPYFHGSLADEERYQTMFADRTGSAAAPTAGLHFTESVVEGLAERNIEIARIELEIGLDTFRPMTSPDLDEHRMHSERVEVSAATAAEIGEARERGGRIIAVGTTTVRALEAAGAGSSLAPMSGRTDLFIKPGHRFRVVDLVVTNFHVPGSTLVVLVAALLGERWRDVYGEALRRGYRFLSFGDAMLAEIGR